MSGNSRNGDTEFQVVVSNKNKDSAMEIAKKSCLVLGFQWKVTSVSTSLGVSEDECEATEKKLVC